MPGGYYPAGYAASKTPVWLAELVATSPAAPNSVALYGFDVAGITHPFVTLSDGTVIDLTPAGVAPAPADRNYWVDTAVADAALLNQRPTQALTAPLAVTSIAGQEGPIRAQPTGLNLAGFRYGLCAAYAAGIAGPPPAGSANMGFMVDGRVGNAYMTAYGTLDAAWTGQPYRSAAGVGLNATLRGGNGVTAGAGGDVALQTGTGVAAAHGNILFQDQVGATLLACTNAGAFTFTASTFQVNATGNVVVNSSGGTINFGSDAADGAIGIGTNTTLGRTITVGNLTGTTNVVVNTGTGASSWTLTGAGTFDFIAGTGTVNFASNPIDHTSTFGSQTGVSATTIAGGSGGLRLIAVGPLPSGTVTMQNQTFTPGATHSAVSLAPTWAAEPQVHSALSIQATQNGAATSLTGIKLAMVKATGGTVLASMVGLSIAAPSIVGAAAGDITASYAIDIADQTGTPSITTARGLRFAATGIANSIVWGNSAIQYAAAANNIRFLESTGANGLDFNLTTTTQTINTAGSTNSRIILQSQTFTPAAAHNAVQITPTWAAENFAHTALSITATQNGSATVAPLTTGLNVAVTKATGATTLTTAVGINIAALTVTGAVTNAYGLQIGDQSVAGVATTAYGINLLSQTATAATTRAINVAGTGTNNAIAFGGTELLYASAAGATVLAQSVTAVGAPTALTVTLAALTGITAATECIGVNFNGNVTKTWAAGAGPLATQREFYFQAPTYAGDAATPLVITNAATVAITGAPTQGANMTLSNPLALWVQSGNTALGGGQYVSRTTQGAGNLMLTAAGMQYIIAKTAITVGGDTVTLPAAALVSGRVYVIKDEAGTAGADNITINATAGNVDGAASIAIATNFGARMLYSTGANWFTMSLS